MDSEEHYAPPTAYDRTVVPRPDLARAHIRLGERKIRVQMMVAQPHYLN